MNGDNRRKKPAAASAQAHPAKKQTRQDRPLPQKRPPNAGNATPVRANNSKRSAAVRQSAPRRTSPAPAPAPEPTRAGLTEMRRAEAQKALRERNGRESPALPRAEAPQKNAANADVRPSPRKAERKAENRPAAAPGAKKARRELRPAGQPVRDAARTPHRSDRPVQPERPVRADRTIRQQTPERRKEQRKGKRITGSVKDLEVNRHTKTSRATFRVKKKKQSWRTILSRITLFFVVFLLLFGVFSALFYLRLTHLSGMVSGTYTVQIGENDAKDTETESLPANRFYMNNTYSVPIDLMRDYCEFTVTGDSETLRYIPRGSTGQSVKFRIGSDVAWINGVQVRLEKPSYLYGGSLYVPISFFDRYVKNLSVQHAPSDNKITVVRVETAESVASIARDKVPVYEPITFTLSGEQPLDGITEQSVDES